MSETILANAQLVLPTETVTGGLRLRDGRIAEIHTGAAVPAGAVDCGGDLLMPGLIELHTDNLERHIEPRPKVNWPHAAAIIAQGDRASVTTTGATQTAILNDLQAQGHALGHIAPEYLRPLIAGPQKSGAAMLVVGVGTGMNAAPVHETPWGRIVVPSECGHISMPVRKKL